MRSFRERYGALQRSETRQIVRERSSVPIELAETGALLRNSEGEFFVAEARRREPLLISLSERLDLRSNLLFRERPADPLRPHEILFLDTETTGLAGGTGTHAFLVGLGYFEGDALVLRQYFMRSPAEERAMLEELRCSLGDFRVLVTFNGKSFDWPLLDTRFLMHGYRLRFQFSHLDLLHPARRIWKHRLASCSLTSLEQRVFGVQRAGDVPGYLIPQLYFDYLRDGDSHRLAPVFSHNREDIVTLSRLLETLLSAEADPASHLRHDEDRVGMGLALISSGAIEAGYRTLAQALAGGSLNSGVRRRAELELWRLMKRSGRMEDGVEMLKAMCREASRSSRLDTFPFVELAKYYEHVERNYGEAARIVEHAIRLMDLHGQSAGRDELMHRMSRVRRKALLN